MFNISSLLRQLLIRLKKFFGFGGFVSGEVLDAAGVDTLSKEHTHNEARYALLSVFKGSATRFVAVLKARAYKMEEDGN